MDGQRASELNIGIVVGMKKCKQPCNTKKDQQKDDSVSSWALAQCCYRELQIQSNVFVVNDLYNQTMWEVSRSPGSHSWMIYIYMFVIYGEYMLSHPMNHRCFLCNFLWFTPKIVSSHHVVQPVETMTSGGVPRRYFWIVAAFLFGTTTAGGVGKGKCC